MIKCKECCYWHQTSESWGDCEVGNRIRLINESCECGSVTPAAIAPLPKPRTIVTPRKTVTYQTPSRTINIPAAAVAERPALYKHQEEDIAFFDNKTEIALFLEMGLGKSAEALVLASRKFKRKEIDALLVIAPNDVHWAWYKEQLPLWLDVPYEAQCLFGRGGQKTAYAFDNDPEVLQVVCVNVDTFSTPQKWQEITEWANSKKTFIVLDEATSIKNVNSQRTQHILYGFNDVERRGKTIVSSVPRSVARAILTGTPVTNGAMDLWSLCEFLRPNFFGRNWYAFQNRYGMFTRMTVEGKDNRMNEIRVPLSAEMWESIKRCGNYEKASCLFGISQDSFDVIHSQDHYEGPYKHADELKEFLKPVAVFRKLTDCVDMPPQNFMIRSMQMSKDQRECYDSMVSEFIAQYDTHTATALNKMTALIRLQQISSGFLCDKTLLVKDNDEESIVDSLYGIDEVDVMPNEIKWIGTSNPKLEALYRDIEEVSKPVIIITRFTAEAARIYDELAGKYNTCLITGWKRVGTIDEFKANKYDVMVANIAAIAKGHNLQNSHTMLKYSNTFSMEYDEQVNGRIFRIGQKEPCEYVSYCNEDSVDEKIISALLLKRNLLDYIRKSSVKDMVA